jgi:hypothetical protein
MRRREFISLLGAAAAVWPLAVRAQQPTLPVVGFIRIGSADANTRNVAAFRKGLGEAGYVEGQNVTIELDRSGIRGNSRRENLFHDAACAGEVGRTADCESPRDPSDHVTEQAGSPTMLDRLPAFD